jgi:predicted Zn-dependent protease
LLRDNRISAADAEVATLRKLKLESHMLENLTAQLQLRRQDTAGALRTLRAAVQRYPHARALTYALVEVQIASGEAAAALALTQKELQLSPGDARMHGLQAKTFAMLGKRLQQHRAQAEAYMAEGLLNPAIEQLELARKAGDGDFYDLSQVDARLRELKQRRLEELREQRRQ